MTSLQGRLTCALHSINSYSNSRNEPFEQTDKPNLDESELVISTSFAMEPTPIPPPEDPPAPTRPSRLGYYLFFGLSLAGLLAYTFRSHNTRFALTFNNIINLRSPQNYHGENITSGFYERWYYKAVDLTTNTSVVVIPGVYYAKKTADPTTSAQHPFDRPATDTDHAFVMVLSSHLDEALYYRYDLSEFHDDTKNNSGRLRLRIGDANTFEFGFIQLDLPQDRLVLLTDAEWTQFASHVQSNARQGLITANLPNSHLQSLQLTRPTQHAVSVHAELKFGPRFNRPPSSLDIPTVMGRYAYLPFLEWNHGLTSLVHEVHGWLRLEEEDRQVVGNMEMKEGVSMGKGYIGKDWGTEFPERWVSIQSNNFLNQTDSGLEITITSVPLIPHNSYFARLLTTPFPFLASYLQKSIHLVTVYLKKADSNQAFIQTISSYEGARIRRLRSTVGPMVVPKPEGSEQEAKQDPTLYHTIELLISDYENQFVFDIEARRPLGRGKPYRVPTAGGHTLVEKTGDAVVTMRIWKMIFKNQGIREIVVEDTAVMADMEVFGDLEGLI